MKRESEPQPAVFEHRIRWPRGPGRTGPAGPGGSRIAFAGRHGNHLTSSGGVARSTKPPATNPGTGSIPVPPLGTPPGGSAEGEEAESPSGQPAAPRFEAGDNPGPDPWIPIGIGLGASALALGSVLFLGRRFTW